ncbi:thiol:disulfide interchange protein DsbA/DsbL [Glaciecola sp. MH2013]|uniref:thiol:disulfide interchange protein DsbA/DsbL n=1 Tax=Glaciecola sp. MH2013 TaxID=2785524 RepID=UPI00189D481B|nr:thiol:disulfide interchange protein DsbA/DsbL [Glaciecola sp. MH2013]MBF7071903.1 thiol:disulfide interchange protein DsbA/DsbL [Glaciecola sp. MH2013]
MKKFLSLFLLVVLLPFYANAQDAWQEGKHYKVISETRTAKPEVKEFFSFWCPACYRFEPLVKNIKDGLDKDVKFTKVHVNFMSLAGPEVQENATTAMVIARALKKEEELNGAIFNYIHQQRSVITGLKDLRNIFVVNGVDGEEFDKLAKSFSVKSLANKNNKQVVEFRQHVTGVPNFIVNGKYQATFSRDMTTDQIVELIVWLTKQP